MQVNTLLQATCKMYATRFDIHTVKQQEVVTSTSPEILIGKNCPCMQVERAKIWNSIVSKLAVLKKYKCTAIIMAQNAVKCYAQNAENNIMLII